MRAVFALLAAVLASPAYGQGDAPRAATVLALRPLSEIALYPLREASAQVVSLNESRIAAEISGRIEAIQVRVGERVAPGAVLARIECSDHELARDRARASLEAARARLELAQQQLERARELGTHGFLSQEAVASRQTEVQVLRAEAEQSRIQLGAADRAVGKCVVRAPFPAVVRERLGQVGELAAPGSPLVAISDAGRIEVAAQVQLGDAESLKKARELRFVGSRESRPLVLLRVSPAIAPQARTVEARLRFKDEPAAAGASGTVTWRDSRAHIPADLVVRRQGRLGVFVEERGIARFRALAEAQEGRPAPADLSPGARVVVTGQLTLLDGQALSEPGK